MTADEGPNLEGPNLEGQNLERPNLKGIAHSPQTPRLQQLGHWKNCQLERNMARRASTSVQRFLNGRFGSMRPSLCYSTTTCRGFVQLRRPFPDQTTLI